MAARGSLVLSGGACVAWCMRSLLLVLYVLTCASAFVPASAQPRQADYGHELKRDEYWFEKIWDEERQRANGEHRGNSFIEEELQREAKARQQHIDALRRTQAAHPDYAPAIASYITHHETVLEGLKLKVDELRQRRRDEEAQRRQQNEEAKAAEEAERARLHEAYEARVKAEADAYKQEGERETKREHGKRRAPLQPSRKASPGVQCCDGTLSPTCVTPHRGCCSHHGGVC